MNSVPTDGPRLFFSSTIFPPFIGEDEEILRRHYPVRKVIAHGLRGVILNMREVLRSDVVVSWFGSVYAAVNTFLARVLGKRSVIIIAGVDASKDKEINYGIWLTPWKAAVLRWAYRHADKVLAVDPFLEHEAARLAEYDGANILSISFGYDPEAWFPSGEKKTMVLTVASCENRWRLKKKGIDKLFAAARELPGIPFRVIGIHPVILDEVKSDAPPNVEIIAHVPRERLVEEYRLAKVYCQPSFTEGLPNTLCEAMLCGCIPVGTIAGGIPTAIGDAGYLVEYRDQPALVRALRQALDAPVSDGLKARERIAREFTFARREQSLCNVVDDLWRSRSR